MEGVGGGGGKDPWRVRGGGGKDPWRVWWR